MWPLLSMWVPSTYMMIGTSNNKFGEANTGERYRELFRDLITSRNQLLVPIILYVDGTHIDGKGCIEVRPVSFTTSLFSEKVRGDHKAWRLLGYVPDLDRGQSSAMNKHANRLAVGGCTTRNFHNVMDVILKGTMAVGQAGNDCWLKKVPLKVGYRWIVVDIICPLLFVINDGKQGDQLCCCANGHHRSQRRHHRSCDCQFDDLDNPDVQCTFLTTDVITDLLCVPATHQTTWAKYAFTKPNYRVLGLDPFSPATRNMLDIMKAGFGPKYRRRVQFSVDEPEKEIQPCRWSVSAASPRTCTPTPPAKNTPHCQSMSSACQSALQAEPRRSTHEPKACNFYIPGWRHNSYIESNT